MIEINDKEVVYAVLHAPLFYPTVGHLKTTLTNVDDGMNKAVTMWAQEGFLAVKAPLSSDPKRHKIILVPNNSVAFMVLAD